LRQQDAGVTGELGTGVLQLSIALGRKIIAYD
jgi:hypothetical protein